MDKEEASGLAVGAVLLAARSQLPTCLSRCQSRSASPYSGAFTQLPPRAPPPSFITVRSTTRPGRARQAYDRTVAKRASALRLNRPRV